MLFRSCSIRWFLWLLSLSSTLVRPTAPRTHPSRTLGPDLPSSMCDPSGLNTTTFPSSAIALTEANAPLTSASKILMLHLLPPRTNSNVASPSTRMKLPAAAADFVVFVDLVLVTPFIRIGQTLSSAPESTILSTISCTISIAFTSSPSHALSTRVKMSNCFRLRKLAASPAFFLCSHIFRHKF